MDKAKALALEEKLKGKNLGDWIIGSLINHGKSAAVFIAHQGHERAAVKIFDDELIATYGDLAQLARIERELSLVGQNHPHMVKLFGGGVDTTTDNHYLIMEFLDGQNLKQCLKDIPVENVGLLISQLADCGRFLEEKNLVHRDIKPENIAILDNFSRLVLLDFGVLRPVGEVGLTDSNGVQSFVGTLQYSSPEFLFREEVDSVEGWRALTFYQIGAVLHDLIMRTELFSDRSNPYTRLVMAVRDEIPTIHNKSVPGYLIDLAKICLSKQPELRTNLLTWASFSPPEEAATAADAAKLSVTSRQMVEEAIQASDSSSELHQNELLRSVIDTIKLRIRVIRNSNSSSLPPVVVTKENNAVTVSFGPNENYGLPEKLSICYSVEILDPSISAISLSSYAYLREKSDSSTTPAIKVFSGVFNANSINSVLENCVYIAVEKAQEFANEGTDGLIDLSVLES